MGASTPLMLAAQLRANSTAGAAVLSRRAMTMLRDWIIAHQHDVDLPARARECALLLGQARPTMGAIGSLMDAWTASLESNEHDFAHRAAAHCDAVLGRADRALQETVRRLRARLGLLPPGSAVLTHSASSTVRRAVAGQAVELIVTASEPGGEGRRMARDLGASCIDDAAAIHAVGTVAAVVVGADAIGRESFVNKVGTARLARAAHAAGTPFYVVAESYKWLPYDSPTVAEPAFERIANALVTAFVADCMFSRSAWSAECCAP